MREDIDVGWVFLGKAKFEYDSQMCERTAKCRLLLVEVMELQVQGLKVKLRRAKDIEQDSVEVSVATKPFEDITTTGGGSSKELQDLGNKTKVCT